MADHGGVCGVLNAGIDQSFEAAGRPRKEQRADRRIGDHGYRLHNAPLPAVVDRYHTNSRPGLSKGFAMLSGMDAVTLTRQLVDIESITGNEAAVGNHLYG